MCAVFIFTTKIPVPSISEMVSGSTAEYMKLNRGAENTPPPTPPATASSFPDGSSIKSSEIANIIYKFAAISIPFIALSGILVAIIFLYRVPNNIQIHSDLLPGEIHEKNVYYVRINSSTLVLLGSFSSSIASILITTFMSLVSYPVARRLLLKVQAQNNGDLPTSYQLGLLITLLNGGLGSLWSWIKYMFSRNKAVPGAV